MGILYTRINELCREHGVTGYKLCKDTGISPGILSDLKADRKSGVSAKTANKIASYFNVSVGYLLGAESPGWHGNCYDASGSEENPYELRLSEAFDRLDLDGQQELTWIAEGMAADKKEQPAEPNLDELSPTKRYLIDAINRLPEDQLQVLAAVIDQVMHGRGE